MARRSDIDWERVERLYIAGQLTIKQVSAECGVSDSQIRAKAKKEGWQRNLAEAIRERTKAKVSAIDVSALIEQSAVESASKSAALIREAIEQASDVAAGVELRHRADIRLDYERAQNLEALFDQHIQKAEGIGDVLKASQCFKNIVDAKTKTREQERTIYGLDEGKGGNDDELPSFVIVDVDGPGAD